MPPSAFVVARKECNLGEALKESTACDKETFTAHDRENKENDPLQSSSTSGTVTQPAEMLEVYNLLPLTTAFTCMGLPI